MLFSVIIYLVLALCVFKIEHKRKPDVLSLFLFVFFLQIVLPGICIALIFIVEGHNLNLGNAFLDKTYQQLTDTVAATVAMLSVLFVTFLYVGYSKLVCKPIRLQKIKFHQLVILRERLLFFVVFGLFSMIYLISAMPGANLGEKYFSLVLFRAQHESVFEDTRNFITSNLFSLTQTFAIASVCTLLYLKDKYVRIPKTKFFFAISIMLFFAVFAVSRRIIFIQIFIIYFSIVLMTGKWFFKFILLPLPVAIVWLGYGKELLWQIPQFLSGSTNEIYIDDQNFLNLLLGSLSSLGISLNSSWATLIFMSDSPIRFGIDHFLTVLRFLPLGSFGIDEYELYGPRIVRVSTEAFVDSGALDIPPGLIGQMWIDFRFLGPIIWGLAFGFILRLTNFLFNKLIKTWVSCGFFSVLSFVIALPINSGSLDFNFSVDMFFLLIFISWMSKLKKINSYNHEKNHL